MERIPKAIFCVGILSLVMLFTEKQSFAQPVSPKNNNWYLYNDSNTVFVFVHGLFSDSEECWCSTSGAYWPELLCQDKRFGDPSIFLGGYLADSSSGTYRISDAAKELYDNLAAPDRYGNQPPLSKDNIVFIAHSAGGLVVRYLLVKNYERFKDKKIGLVLLASPSTGASLANYMKWLAWINKNIMVPEISENSNFIIDLTKRWDNLIEENMIQKLVMAAWCENKFIIPKWIFNGYSVVTLKECESVKGIDAAQIIPNTTHFTIAKPESKGDPIQQAMVSFYENQFKPIMINRQIPDTTYLQTAHIKCKDTKCSTPEKHSGWSLSGSLSYFQFSPNLPRDMTIHETHPQDRPFLKGSAGTTDLSSVKSVFFNLSVEHDWRVSAGMDWGLQYSLKIPIGTEGRLEKLNENENRSATEGSYIYSDLKDMSLAHEAGINLSYHSPADSPINYTIKPGIYLGYWQMSFEKGWTRYGQDEPALVSDAKGFSLSPQISVIAGNHKLGLALNAAYRFIDLKYDTEVLGSSTAQGWELGMAIVFGL